ncbi:MAG: hypothetical protein ACI8Y4_005271 [Candidatus Poriferisodalaceae bacterium]|jgi:hypothetical protein
MLKLSKKGVSMIYKVTNADGAELGVLKGCGKGQTGEIDIAGLSFVFTPVSEPWTFKMTQNGAPTGTAERTKAKQHFVINYGGTEVELDCPFIGNKPYKATIGGQVVGSISLSKFTGRVVTVDLPDALPLEARLFAGWLTLRTWNAGAEVRAVPV